MDSFGLVAEISLEVTAALTQDYHDKRIKIHEKILPHNSINSELVAEKHIGPVTLAHKKNPQITQLLMEARNGRPYATWNTKDGRIHSLWRAGVTTALTDAYQRVAELYVLDGHHRLAAAHALH